MPRQKTVYVSEATHRRLKILAARRNRSMGDLLEDLVAREAEELENPWVAPAGLRLQEAALREVWGAPELDVYDDLGDDLGGGVGDDD